LSALPGSTRRRKIISLGVSFTETWTFFTAEKLGEFGQFMIVGGEERARTGVLLKMFDDGHAMERPSNVAVPRPTSSRRTSSRRGVIQNGGDFAHLTRKVERPRARLSLAPMRVKMRSVMGSLACRAGTKEPIWP